MVQRIQSFFLLLTSIFFWAEFKLPMASSDTPATGYFSDQMFNIQDHLVFVIIAVLGGVISLVNIFLYRNRNLQIRIAYMLIVLALLILITTVFLFINYSNSLGQDVKISDRFGIYLPIAAIITTILSIRFIRKDEKLVKSMDRLR